MSTSIQRADGTLGQLSGLIKKRESSIAAAAASNIRPERFAKIILRVVQQTPALLNCTPESIFRSMLMAAELGLEPSAATGEAYLVPYGRDCTLIVGYRGMIALAMRSGHVLGVSSRAVYEGDDFQFGTVNGVETLNHTPNMAVEPDPAKLVAVYCIVRLRDADPIIDVMRRSEVERIRKRSRSGSSGPWATDFVEMSRKTVTRRALKYAPMSVEMAKAMALDAADAGDQSGLLVFDGLDDDDLALGEPETQAEAVAHALGVSKPVAEDPASLLENPEGFLDGEE
jgi:recombination protein RecT